MRAPHARTISNRTRKNALPVGVCCAPEGPAVSCYRCYFLDAANHVAADHFVECETDDLAQARADALLATTPYPAMEVWDGARFVYQAKHHSGQPPAN